MNKITSTIAAVFLYLLTCCAVFAQSSPNLITKQVPTAAQWNSYFTAKQDTLGYQPVNKAGDIMSGKLVTPASTTSRAGFSILPGVAPASPVNGDIWATTAGVYVRVNGATVGPLVSSATVGLTVGSTAIASGTTTRVLYDNAGVLGEYTISGTGSVVMSSGSTITSGVITGMTSVTASQFVADSASSTFPKFQMTPGLITSGTDGIKALNSNNSGHAILQFLNGNAALQNVGIFLGTNAFINTSQLAAQYDAANPSGGINLNSITGNFIYFGSTAGNTPTIRFTISRTGGVEIGSPTGGDEGAATLNVAGDIYNNGISPTGSGGYVRSITPALSSPTIQAPTITTSFTATGLVKNADLVNAATTVNGQTCTLGSTCTVTAVASQITVGTTTVSGGTTTRILYDNAGVVGEYPIGTGVATALSTSVGSAGAFVVNGGALGSPSSAGTLPAFTLGGTISGGGNQINNAVIGASTPLAGTFTTLTGTAGSLTGLTTFALRDTSAAFDVTLAAVSSTTLTAGRTLTFDLGNVAHTLKLGTTANTITFPNAASDTVGMLAVANAWTGNQSFAGTSLFTGGLPLLSNGNASVAASATLGGIFTGKGSSKDVSIENGAGSVVCDIATGTTTINCATLTLTNRLTSASIDLATNATIGVMRGDSTTISCVAGVCTAVGAAATSIAVGTTTITSGTTTRILYDNAGVLGEYTITGTGTIVAMAAGPTFTGTLSASVGSFSSTLASAALTVTSASATAQTVGRLGATTPAFQVDASPANSITGMKITAAATGGGVALAAIGETNVNTTIDAAGSGTITLNGTGTGNVTTPRVTTFTNSTASSSTSTGAVVVTGGLGVGGAANFGGVITSTVAGTQSFGDSAGNNIISLNGASSGSGGGAVIRVQSGGSSKIIMGIYSAILGGTFDATGTIFTAAAMRLYAGDNGSLGCSLGLKTDASGTLSCVSSSARFKDNIRSIENPISVIDALEPRQYTRKDEGGRLSVGLIAEEVEKIDRRLVFYGPDGRVLGVDYYGVLAELVAVVKQQQHQLEGLQR